MGLCVFFYLNLKIDKHAVLVLDGAFLGWFQCQSPGQLIAFVDCPDAFFAEIHFRISIGFEQIA